MASKIIYVSSEHAGEYDEISILSPKKLDAILESPDWVIVKRKTMKVVLNRGTNKTVRVECIELGTPSAERSLSMRNQDEESPAERAISPFTAQRGHQGGGGGEVSVIGENPDGYMGRSIAKHIPGVRIVSGMMTHAAYGLGADQAKSSFRESDNPFPVGGIPWTEWFQGYFSADGKTSSEVKAAMKEGAQAAKGGPDDEAHCSYQRGTKLYEAWLWAFKKGGGRVE